MLSRLRLLTRVAKLPMKIIPLMNVQVRNYYKDGVLMPRAYGDGYMNDPVVVGERIVRCIALHDNVNDPSNITLG